MVQIGTTGSAKSLTIFPALNVRRCCQQPVFSYRPPKIKISIVRIVQEDIGIIRFVRAELGEKQVDVLIDIDFNIFEAQPTGLFDAAFDPT
ncbi:MAG TPA: hypothetical protein VGN73_15365 [Gemmatimonadaceae bacterium]|nr:hypothetical protein [Gemmatimonadaceae bacterium]